MTRQKEVIQLYNEGLTFYEIATQLNIAHKTVYVYLKGYEDKERFQALSPFLKMFGEMINYHRTTVLVMTRKELATLLNTSPQAINNIEEGKSKLELERAINIMDKLHIKWELGDLKCEAENK